MNSKKHIFLIVIIILSILFGNSSQKSTNAQFDISQIKNEGYQEKFKERRNFESQIALSNSLRHANDPIIGRICKKTGCSCGPSSFPCAAEDVFNVANEIEEVIDNIDRRYQDNQADNLLRCNGGCKKLYKHQERIIDSFPDNTNINSMEQNSGDQNLLQAVLSELNEISNTDNKKNYKLRTRVALTPEDIYDHYRSAMEQVRETLLGFIKYRTNLSVVRGLPREVRKRIQAIRDRYRHFKMSDKSLKKQICQVFLDDILKIKIVANKDPEVSYDVFIPDWMYLEVLKKKNGKLLRSGKRSMVKRILPLTLQQKQRLQKKQGPKKLLKFVWRRSLSPDKGQYGVPFVLDIQGLGQLN